MTSDRVLEDIEKEKKLIWQRCPDRCDAMPEGHVPRNLATPPQSRKTNKQTNKGTRIDRVVSSLNAIEMKKNKIMSESSNTLKNNKPIRQRCPDRFDVTPEGYVRLVRAIGRAEATRVWLGLRTDDDDDDGAPTAATVVEIGVEDVNEAPRFDAYPPTLVVGYPTRTVLDPSVPMPLFAFDAADADDGANAALSYALAAPSADGFHLGAADGVLAVRGVDRLPDCSTDAAGCRLQVVATDGGGLRAQQNVAVSTIHLKSISTIHWKSFNEDLVEVKSGASLSFCKL